MLAHRERIKSLGIAAEALQPKWCQQNQGSCPSNSQQDTDDNSSDDSDNDSRVINITEKIDKDFHVHVEVDM